MECKSCWCWGGFGWCSELIDTLWNVNISEMNKEQLMRFELIDTLWNVN